MSIFNNCPICNKPMHIVENTTSMFEMDATTNYQCSNNNSHKFYWHPFHTIRLSLTSDFNDTLQRFNWMNNQWIAQ